jgi:uncharacterized protein
MDARTIENIIAKTLHEVEGFCTIGFQGGEPTLAGLDFFESAVAMQKRCNTRGIKIQNTLQTNGYAITGEWAEFFSRNDFLVGVSIDGLKETHDACRKGSDGDGTFGRIAETTELLDAYGVEYNVLTVVNAVTAPRVREIYDFYEERGYRYLQFIPCLEPLGAVWGEKSYSLAPEAYGKFLCSLFDLWRDSLESGRQPYIRSFENYVGIFLGIMPESCDLRGVCGIQYAVEYDGSVFPCDFFMLDEYKLGCLNTDTFAQLDEKREEIEFIENSETLPSECAECECIAICRNGCRRYRNGSGKNIFCESFRMFFNHAGKRFEKIAKKMIAGRGWS